MSGTRAVGKITRHLFSLALCVGLFMLFCAAGWKDMLRSLPEEAEQAYRQNNYEQALQLYQEAQTRNPDSDTLAYNLGNTLYKLGRFEDAAGQFSRIMEKDSTSLSPQSIYNMGNSLFKMGQAGNDQQMLNQALEAFKHSIINDPTDEDSKYNYELTKRMIQQQEQQQQQNNDDQEKKDDDQQDDQQQQDQEQDKQQEQEQQKEQENNPDKQQPQQQQEEQEQKPQPQPGEMSEEEAEKILQALMQMEKDAQESEQKKRAPAASSKGRDW